MIFETFSYRKKIESRGERDIYQYEEAPPHLRHQLCMTLCEGIGPFHDNDGLYWNNKNANDYWIEIDRICRKEIYSYLPFVREPNLATRFCNYLMNEKDINDFLSGVEIGCAMLSFVKDDYGGREARGADLTGVAALDEINHRFDQHCVGYRFENGLIIRVDSKLVHAEIVKPALTFLTHQLFSKANEDFMAAHAHYRSNAYKDCVTAANRSFESTLKAICDAENWAYGRGDRASELVTKVNQNGLFTHEFDKSFSAYVAMLKAGLPNVRNDAGGHGEGVAAASVTPHIARFALNLTAANILFLCESYEALKAKQGD